MDFLPRNTGKLPPPSNMQLLLSLCLTWALLPTGNPMLLGIKFVWYLHTLFSIRQKHTTACFFPPFYSIYWRFLKYQISIIKRETCRVFSILQLIYLHPVLASEVHCSLHLKCILTTKVVLNSVESNVSKCAEWSSPHRAKTMNWLIDWKWFKDFDY